MQNYIDKETVSPIDRIDRWEVRERLFKGASDEEIIAGVAKIAQRVIEDNKFNGPASQKLKEDETQLDTKYKKQLRELPIQQLQIWGVGFLAWIIPILVIYALGMAIGWVYRGFKQTKGGTP